MNETSALARYLAKKCNYRPFTPKQEWEVDSTFDFLYEKWGKIAPIAFMKKMDDDSSKVYLESSVAIM